MTFIPIGSDAMLLPFTIDAPPEVPFSRVIHDALHLMWPDTAATRDFDITTGSAGLVLETADLHHEMATVVDRYGAVFCIKPGTSFHGFLLPG